MARVVIENLAKTFKGPGGKSIQAVNRANLTIEDGELLVLVGPSGCGKTTLLRLIAGLEEITSGTVSIDGQIVNKVAPKDRDLAMVFQTYALYPHLTARENMAFGLMLRKTPRAEIDQRVREAAELLGLAACLDQRPRELSGGQRQRVALGRAIVRNPKLFLLDEPLSNLDAPLRAQMRLELSKLHSRLKCTMLHVTHDQAEAMILGQRVAVMKDGAIQQVAPPLELYHRPANCFVAGFIGSPPMNFIHGVLIQREGGTFFQEQAASKANAPDGLVIPLAAASFKRLGGQAGRKIILGVRPEHLMPASDARHGFTMAVSAVEVLGAETFVHATTGAHALVARMPAAWRAEAGAKLMLGLDLDQVHFFDPETGKAVCGKAA